MRLAVASWHQGCTNAAAFPDRMFCLSDLPIIDPIWIQRARGIQCGWSPRRRSPNLTAPAHQPIAQAPHPATRHPAP